MSDNNERLELILDLRTDVEVGREGPGPMASEPRVRIEHHSLYRDSGGNTDLDTGTVRPWGAHQAEESPGEPPVVRAYVSYLRRRPESIVAALRAIARADGAVLVHCAAGKDRTGVVVAVARRSRSGTRRDVSDYLATGDRIEAIIARLISSPTLRSELESDTHRSPERSSVFLSSSSAASEDHVPGSLRTDWTKPIWIDSHTG